MKFEISGPGYFLETSELWLSKNARQSELKLEFSRKSYHLLVIISTNSGYFCLAQVHSTG